MLPVDLKKKRKDGRDQSDHGSPKRRKVENQSEMTPEEMFKWLIHPITPEQFYSKYWENTYLHISRNNPNYYNNPDPLFCLHTIQNALRDLPMHYGENIDITSYSNEERKTLNKPGDRVHESEAMEMFHKNQCTIRVLHPQEFSDKLYNVCSVLQDWFGCVVGSNVYITPPDAQGFAPHYDDVDVFILQTEGRKLWRLYEPLPGRELPEVSSGNFEQDEIGKPIKELWLEQGDVLYFPRGVIHQASTDKTKISTHITVSTVQKWTWGHYLQKAVSSALLAAFAEDIEFRKVLPRQFQEYIGVMHSDNESEERNEFLTHAMHLVEKAISNLPLDEAGDQMAVDFLYDSLSPYPRNQEPPTKVSLNSSVRLISKNSVRIVCEDESIFFYHNTLNTAKYHEVDPQYIEFPLEAADALEDIINSFPKFIQVKDLPLEEDEDKLNVVRVLVAAKILLLD